MLCVYLLNHPTNWLSPGDRGFVLNFKLRGIGFSVPPTSSHPVDIGSLAIAVLWRALLATTAC